MDIHTYFNLTYSNALVLTPGQVNTDLPHYQRGRAYVEPRLEVPA